MKLGLHLRYPPERRHRRLPGEAPPFDGGASFGITASSLFSVPLPPFPMHRAFPARITTAAPSHPARSAVGAPIPPRSLDANVAGTPTRWFPCSLLFARRRRSPTVFQRPRHRCAAGLPCDLTRRHPYTASKVLAAIENGETRRARPRSARFESVSVLKDTTPVPRVLLSVTLAGPSPSGSTGTFPLRQGCSHPHRHHPAPAALSYVHLLRQANGDGLSSPLEPQRLTAQSTTLANFDRPLCREIASTSLAVISRRWIKCLTPRRIHSYSKGFGQTIEWRLHD